MVDQALLTQICKIIAALPPVERLAFNIQEASKATGIDEQQISNAINRRELPARKIGKSWRITRQNLLIWLEQ